MLRAEEAQARSAVALAVCGGGCSRRAMVDRRTLGCARQFRDGFLNRLRRHSAPSHSGLPGRDFVFAVSPSCSDRWPRRQSRPAIHRRPFSGVGSFAGSSRRVAGGRDDILEIRRRACQTGLQAGHVAPAFHSPCVGECMIYWPFELYKLLPKGWIKPAELGWLVPKTLRAYAMATKHRFTVERRQGLLMLLDRQSYIDTWLLVRGSWERPQIEYLSALIGRHCASRES